MMREKSEDWLNETVQTSLHMPLVRMHVDFSNLSCRKETSKMRWRKESTSEMVGHLLLLNMSLRRHTVVKL